MNAGQLRMPPATCRMVRFTSWQSPTMASASLKSFPSKKLGRKNSKSVLSGDQDLSRVLSAASQIKQAEQHAGRADAEEFVEIARHALAVVHSGDFRAAQKGHIGMSRIGGPQCGFTATEQGAH